MPIKMSFAYDANKLSIYDLTHLIQAFRHSGIIYCELDVMKNYDLKILNFIAGHM